MQHTELDSIHWKPNWTQTPKEEFKYMDAFSRVDAASVASLYTEDAKLLPPGSPMMTGKEAIQTFWQGAMDTGIKGIRLDTVKVESEGNLAYEIGKFVLTVQPEGGEIVMKTGKYVVVWKNQDGTLKLDVDIYNVDEA